MRLTPAEREVLEAYGRVGTAKGVAEALGKSRRTVEHQLASIRGKFEVDRSVQAVKRV